MLDPVKGASRALIDTSEVEGLFETQTLILDAARTRPFYFDGRFLTAADLTRDQVYVRSRQADLARAGGYGVVYGLEVQLLGDGSRRRLRINPGHGITPAGETVIVTGVRDFDVGDVATMQRLDASLGIRRLPTDATRERTGLFIVAVRPIEFSAKPIASYPTSLTGQRSLHDGDIIEAAAVTLIPYNDHGNGEPLSIRRARAAREIFLEGNTRGLPQEALALAMVGMDRGVIQWVDVFMVRREVGTESFLQSALGAQPRALREAWVLQYAQQLTSVLATAPGARFPAVNYFRALPPAGPLPAAAILSTPDGYLQYYFPPSVDVELSFVPADEVAAMMEESLVLPPIDLTLSDEDLDSTAVLVLAPVTRAKLKDLNASLATLTRTLKPAAPGLIAKRRPLQLLELLGRPSVALLPQIASTAVTSDSAWNQAVTDAAQANNGLVWYMRRRNLAYRSDLAGVPLPLSASDLDGRLNALGLTQRFAALRSAAPDPAVQANLGSFLSTPKILQSNLLLLAAVIELERLPTSPPPGPITQDRFGTVAKRYSDTNLGTGLARLLALQPSIDAEPRRTVIAASGRVPELDAKARAVPQPNVANFAAKLVEMAAAGRSDLIQTL